MNHLPYDQTRQTPSNDDHPDRRRTSGNHESLFAANQFLSHDVEDLDLENLNLAHILNATQSLLLTKASVSASASLAMEIDSRRNNRCRWVVLLEIKFGRATPARIGSNTVWLARAQIFFASGFNALSTKGMGCSIFALPNRFSLEEHQISYGPHWLGWKRTGTKPRGGVTREFRDRRS